MSPLPATAMTAAIAATLAWGCAVAPSPSPSPPSDGSSQPTASATTSDAGAIPPLLLSKASGPERGLWRLDPGVRGLSRNAITAPEGVWRPTAPTVGGLVALTSMNEVPARVALTRLDGTDLTPLWTTVLPTDELWSGGYAECVSSTGTIAVGDGGLTLYTLAGGGIPALVPGQGNNLGECTWVDPTTLLWDQEVPEMRAWRIGATESDPVPIRRFEPTAGGGRVAWFDDSTWTLQVAAIEVLAGRVRVGPTTRGLAFPPDDFPVGLTLSLDGRWLVGLVSERQISVYPVSDDGFGTVSLIPFADVGFAPGDRVTWLPGAR